MPSLTEVTHLRPPTRLHSITKGRLEVNLDSEPEESAIEPLREFEVSLLQIAVKAGLKLVIRKLKARL